MTFDPKLINAVIAFLAFTSCTDNILPNDRTIAVAPLGDTPANHEAITPEKKIVGRDDDSNGIRDDIDDFIKSELSSLSDSQISYTLLIARAHQRAIESTQLAMLDTTLSQSELLDLERERLISIACLSNTEGFNQQMASDIADRLKDQLINSAERYSALREAQLRLGSIPISYPTELVLKDRCSDWDPS